MLYDRDRHEKLTSVDWNVEAARTTIAEIVTASLREYSPVGYWPSHPQDDNGTSTVFYNLYLGAAGVIWALDYFAKLGLAESTLDFSGEFEDLLSANREDVKAYQSGTNGYLIADCGLLLLGARLFGPDKVGECLANAIDDNQSNPVQELMWGSPGTMLAALFMYELTGNEDWVQRFQRDANALWQNMEHFVPADCHLWRQELYGSSVLSLGGVHGFAGNAFPILRGFKLLSVSDQQRWTERIERTLVATAITQDGLVNWPPSVGTPRPGRESLLVQHCHGAPGMINCLAEVPGEVITRLLLGAGELIWLAGPLAKGSNLCHGTAGNGYAFLKLFKRTQDEKWLHRARRFAMHSVEQCSRDFQRYGRHRYSLWTGDLGLAIYLWHCIQGTDSFPTLDVF